MPGLSDLTVAKLDELAEAHDLDGYPAGGNKAEKVAFLDANDVEPAAAEETVYRLRLVEGQAPAHFMADGKAVELTDDDPVFETTDRWAYLGLRDLPFLVEETA